MAATARVLTFAFISLSAALAGDFRVTAPERAVQTRVQVLYPSGTPLYDSDWKSGNIVDLSSLPYGSYELRISSRDLEGKITERVTSLRVSADRTTIDPALPDDLKLTMTAHDGTTGQIITTSGDLSFRFGDYLNKKDTEAMRLSPEGNLDVKGWIRAGEGILFSDGTMVDSKSAAQKKLHPKRDIAGSGSTNRVAKWVSINAELGDSTITDTGSNVGFGTTSPQGRLHIYAAQGNDVIAGMGRDMIPGPALVFGYSAGLGGSGFLNIKPDLSAAAPNPALRFMTADVERMIITNAGNVGIGTSTPGGRLHIYAPATADVFAGIGQDMNAGP